MSRKISKIVVGTDFNAPATAALNVSAAIAAKAGAELIVIYADRFDPPLEFTGQQVASTVQAIERSKIRTRKQLETYVRKNVPEGVVWRVVVADDVPARAINGIAQAEGADFIAVGTHGRGGLQRLVMGSVAEDVIRDAVVPVLTVRSSEDRPGAIRRILSPTSESDIAASLAHALGGELTTINVSENVLNAADSGGYDLIVVGRSMAGVTRQANAPVMVTAK
jgi:nucleotide-binding universal stress UspA family protein